MKTSRSEERRIPRSNRRWLTRTVLGIGLASLFSDMSHETVTAMLPALLGSLGVAAGALGMIEGFADGLSSAAKLWGGWLADRMKRRKPICVAGYGFMALSSPVIAFAGTWLFVLMGRVLAWVSRGVRTPARKALMADAVDPQFYGRAFGLERAMDTTGAIVAPLLVLLFLHLGVGQRTIILLSTIPALLAVAAIALLVEDRPDRMPVTTPFLKSFSGFSGRFKEFLAAVGLFGVGDFAESFYILYAVSVLTPAVGPVRAATFAVALYALHNVLYAVWSYVGGWLSDHVNKRYLIVAGYLSATVAAGMVIAGVSSYVGLAVMFALAGSAIGLYEAVEDSVAADLLPASIRGSGFGALAVVVGIGDLLSSVIVGWLWAAFGRQTAFGYSVVLTLAGAAFMLHLARKTRELGTSE